MKTSTRKTFVQTTYPGGLKIDITHMGEVLAFLDEDDHAVGADA